VKVIEREPGENELPHMELTLQSKSGTEAKLKLTAELTGEWLPLFNVGDETEQEARDGFVEELFTQVARLFSGA
jgi:hypothetical protein